MGSNTFGKLFQIMTWGESHGPMIGVVIDGCPAGLEIGVDEIQQELSKRQPGNSPHTSPRKERDHAQIVSGVFEGKTTGAPISIIIDNGDVDSSKYEPIKEIYRPGHANFTYLEKYGIFDYRGGGRSSARETAGRVAAGAVAKKLLSHYGIDLAATIVEVGAVVANNLPSDPATVRKQVALSSVYCADPQASDAIAKEIQEAKEEGDSLGGVIQLLCHHLPVGLGDPIYEKLEANLAKAMLSLPATKGVEFGSGFSSARMKGSWHNDAFTLDDKGHVSTKTNHAGGLLGGMSNGMPLLLRVAFKPTSSIMKEQESLTLDKEPTLFKIPEGSRHDPCVALRAVPIVEAMGALVLADALLMNRLSELED